MDNSAKIEDYGVLYIYFGEYYAKEAAFSIKSLLKLHKHMPICVITDDVTYVPELVSHVIRSPIEGLRVKQDFLDKTPFKYTLYVDTDTAFVGSIDGIFSLLDRFDIAAVQDHIRVVSDRCAVWPRYGQVSEAFPEYAGGVILYNNNQTFKSFLSNWRKLYHEWCSVSGKLNDQPSFRVALWENVDIKIATLPQEYNVRTQEKRDKSKNIVHRILHWHKMHLLGLNMNRQRF